VTQINERRRQSHIEDFVEVKPKTLGQQARARKAKKPENNLAGNFSIRGG
jgi:hypothetical protein